MKKILSIFALTVALTATATTPRELPLSQGAAHPVLSPDGTHLLYSTDDHTGLWVLDINQGTTKQLAAEPGAGFAPVFAPDGTSVYFRTASLNEGLMYRDIRSCNITSGKVQQLAKPSRKDLSPAPADRMRYAHADLRQINLADGQGNITAIKPLKDAHSYLWASLSPDGSRVLFTEPFEGVMVCDTDGANPRRLLRNGDFPAWVNDRWIVAVRSTDDGYHVTSSRLVAVDTLTGNHTDLTGPDTIVTEATAADGHIVYTTIEGKTFIIAPQL